MGMSPSCDPNPSSLSGSNISPNLSSNRVIFFSYRLLSQGGNYTLSYPLCEPTSSSPGPGSLHPLEGSPTCPLFTSLERTSDRRGCACIRPGPHADSSLWPSKVEKRHWDLETFSKALRKLKQMGWTIRSRSGLSQLP